MEVSGKLHAPAALSTHYIGLLVGPRASLDVMEKRILSCLYQESNPEFSAVQPVA
jgi:hypothetical protein